MRTVIAGVLCLVWIAILIFAVFSKTAAAALAIATPVMMTAVGFLFREPKTSEG
jgi:O-phosphoseryl-tRNA(Cys) synthetase